MRIGIACDHRGVELKRQIVFYLRGKVEKLVDFGTNSEESVDYPLYAQVVGEKIKSNEIDLGILICGTGIGMCIAANKIKSIRCANVNSEEEASLARSHNNANIISIRADFPVDTSIKLIETFINTSFSGEERHVRRLKEIENLEKQS